MQPAAATPWLSVNNIEVIYDHVILVLKGVSLEVPEGRIVALLGANGAGKSTTLRAISGLIRPTAGRIVFDGQSIAGLKPHLIVRRGLGHVPEGRGIFANFTVARHERRDLLEAVAVPHL